MTVRVLGLVSGAGGTSMEDHRLLLQLFLPPFGSDGILHRRSGIVPSSGAADLATASAMQADIAPFVAWIDGTSNALQGGYPFASDATETLTFSDGDATNDRIDLVVAQIRHDSYDGSGNTDGRVRIVEGTPASSPSVPATPDSSIALYQVDVAAGTSAGSGGIDFGADVTDVRTYIRRHRDPDTFLSSGTWTNPEDGFRAIRVRCWGAGGGGGGAAATGAGEVSGGGGGGGGSYAEAVIPAADLGTSETVTVGAGGAGGAAGSSGSSGDSTSFGSHLMASGSEGGSTVGPAGPPRTARGGGWSSGTSGGNVILGRGQTGGNAVLAAAGVSSQVVGGVGGAGAVGGGGQAGRGGSGGDAGQFAAGGGGAASQENGGGFAGGDGSDGRCVVEYIY